MNISLINMIQANKWKNIRQIAAWASYDITNTIFFIGVVGIFFPLWVTNDIGGNDATVGFTMSSAMIVSLVLAPFFGTMTDHYLSKVWYLGIFTFIAILAVPLVGEVPFNLALVLYSIVGFGYEFADRWLLQNYGGSIQQGVYEVGFRFGMVSLLVTMSASL